MSFKLSQFFNFSIHFIIGSFFFILGILGMILPWSLYLQRVTTQFILDNTLIPSLFGLGFVLIGLSIVIYTFLRARIRYIHIKTGDFSVKVDEKVIYTLLESYWRGHFPSAQIPFTVTLKKYSIQIVADLPFLSLPDQKKFLEEAKQDLGKLFGQVLGYPYEVHLITSFANK